VAKSVKLTREEVANAIRREGVKDNFKSSAMCEYWSAFGQRWRIYLSSRSLSAIVTKIEQIDEHGNRISFEEVREDVRT